MASESRAGTRNRAIEFSGAGILGIVTGASIAFMSVGFFVSIASIIAFLFLILRATVPRLRLFATYLLAGGLGFVLIVAGFWS